MNIDQNILKFLKGEDFTSSLIFNIDRTLYEPETRENIITTIIRGHDVIHIGCSDHIPVIREKIAMNKWLHKLITENARSCIGIDIDRESISFLINNLGYANVIHGNVLTDNFREISEKKWDFVVFGEMIEHLDNPVDFLKTFREKYGRNIQKFIITVPNIYNRKNLRQMFQYREIINSDHRFWFTPYTIARLIVAAGYKPDNISFANLISLDTTDLLLRKMKTILHQPVRYPFYYFSSIMVTGSIN